MVRMMKERKDWMEPVAAGCPTTGAEVVMPSGADGRAAVRYRYSPERPRRRRASGRDAVAACAAIAATELGWDQNRAQEEIGNVDAFYEVET